MASLSKDKSGWRITWDLAGVRKTIRLGKTTKVSGQEFLAKVSRLISARSMGTAIDADTAKWVSGLDDKYHSKLVRIGLVDPRVKQESMTLGTVLDLHMGRLHRLKSSTRTTYGNAQRNLCEYFGVGKDVSTIGIVEAEDFKSWMMQQGLASATISRRLLMVRMFFKDMVKRRIVPVNPFQETSLRAGTGAEKRYFVSEDNTTRIMEVADPTWQTIVALARYAGLRCPSEVCSLRWEDVNLPSGRMVITSPKTEHHSGGESRICPIFPRLRPYLEAAWERAPVGATYVVHERYRKAALGPRGWINCNLRTHMLRLIRRAGLHPWARPFHAMRGSLETELMERHPIQVVSAWLGHDTRIALKHYLMVRNSDFEAALESGTQSGTVVAHKAAQQAIATKCKDRQDGLQVLDGSHLMQPFASSSTSIQSNSMGTTCLEHPTESPGNTAILPEAGTESGTFFPSKALRDVKSLLEALAATAPGTPILLTEADRQTLAAALDGISGGWDRASGPVRVFVAKGVVNTDPPPELPTAKTGATP